jgi:ABC-type multidrug transport system fused ATPase/permease subunit
MTSIQIIKYLLSKEQKKQLVVLSILLLVGIFFEMLGLGILIPALGLIFSPDIGNNYPGLQPLLKPLKDLSQIELALYGMGFLVLIYFIKALFLVFISWRQSRFSSDLSADLSRQLFYGYLCQPYAFHLQRNSAHLLRNVQGEIDQFTAVSQAALNLSIEASAIIGVASVLFIAEPLGALVAIVFLAFSAVIFYSLIKNKVLLWGRKRLFHDSQITQHLMQGLGAVKDVKLLGRERYFLNKFDEHNTAKARVLTNQATVLQTPRLYLELLAVIGLAGLIIMMLLQNRPLEHLIPTIGIFVAAAFRMIPSVNRIMSSIQSIRYSGPVLERLYTEFTSIRNLPAQNISDSVDKKNAFTGKVVIKHLEFEYYGTHKKALDGISLSFNIGSTIGFIGSSGSGKSTLIDVFLGLLMPTSGAIYVDNRDIAECMKGWQSQIGYVPQTIFLTDDTIRRNIAFGVDDKEINEDAIMRSVKAAQLDDYISNLPLGLEANVGERGVKLSGGQRQRIGIARALYHDPQILVLDEATSALDTATESEVMKAVNALHGSKTILIVAHRLSTIQNCDKIFKLVDGKIVEGEIPFAVPPSVTSSTQLNK